MEEMIKWNLEFFSNTFAGLKVIQKKIVQKEHLFLNYVTPKASTTGR